MRLKPSVTALLPILAAIALPSLAHAESFTYDSQNRLVRIDNGPATTTLQYDAFGNLVRACRETTCEDLVVDDASGDSVAFVSTSGDASLLSHGPLRTAAIRLHDDSIAFPLHDDSLAPRGLAVLSNAIVDSNGVGASVSRSLSLHRVARDPYGAHRASDLPAPFARHGAFQALALDDEGSLLLRSAAFSTEDATSLQRRSSQGSPFANFNRYAIAAHNPLTSPIAFGTPGATAAPHNPYLDGNVDPNLVAASVGLNYDRSSALKSVANRLQTAAFNAEIVDNNLAVYGELLVGLLPLPRLSRRPAQVGNLFTDLPDHVAATVWGKGPGGVSAFEKLRAATGLGRTLRLPLGSKGRQKLVRWNPSRPDTVRVSVHDPSFGTLFDEQAMLARAAGAGMPVQRYTNIAADGLSGTAGTIIPSDSRYFREVVQALRDDPAFTRSMNAFDRAINVRQVALWDGLQVGVDVRGRRLVLSDPGRLMLPGDVYTTPSGRTFSHADAHEATIDDWSTFMEEMLD